MAPRKEKTEKATADQGDKEPAILLIPWAHDLTLQSR